MQGMVLLESQMKWHIPLILPVVADLCEMEDSLVYTASSRSAIVRHSENLFFKSQNKQQQKKKAEDGQKRKKKRVLLINLATLQR